MTIKITLAIFTFILIFVFLLVIQNSENQLNIKIPRTLSSIGNVKKYFIYLIGCLTTVLVLVIPSSILTVYQTALWESFLNPFVLARTISGLFLISVFPGVFMYKKFLGNKFKHDFFEKAAFIFAFSYCYIFLTGYLLIFLNYFSVFTYVLMIWIPAVLFGLWSLIRKVHQENQNEAMRKDIAFINFNLGGLLLLLTLLAFVVFAYLMTLFIAPLSGYNAWDTSGAVRAANDFAKFGPFVRGDYSGHGYWFLLGSITGIPLQYAFSVVQFMVIFYILAFYTLVRTIFPTKQKVAYVATFFTAFLTGATFLFMIFSSNTLGTYLGGGTINSLTTFWTMIRSPDSMPWIFDAGVDIPLVFLALALCYRYIVGNVRSRALWISSVFFVCAAFITHSFDYVPAFFGAVLFLYIFMKQDLSFLLKFFVAPILLVLALDPISGWFLTAHLFMGGNWEFSAVLLVSGLISLIVISYFAGVLYKRVNINRFEFRGLAKVSAKKVEIALWSLALIVFALAVFLYFKNYANLNYSLMSLNSVYPPWYFFIIKYYGIAFVLSIVSVPFLLKKDNRHFAIFTISWLVGTLLMAPFSYLFPQLLDPTLIFVRNIRFALFPISVIAALGLSFIPVTLRNKSLEKFKTSRIKMPKIKMNTKVTCAILVFVIILPIASAALPREYLYALGQVPSVSGNTVGTVNWINENTPKGSTILPLSDGSYVLLTNLMTDRTIMPVFHVASPTWLSYSWVHDILLYSTTPEAILYTLYSLKVNYIFYTSDDFSLLANSTLLSVMNSFPMVHESGDIKVYAVPKYPLYEDSNYVLVHPSQENEFSTYNGAFNILSSSGVNFSIYDDVNLDQLVKNHVYVFSGNMPTQLVSNLPATVSGGANIIYVLGGATNSSLDMTYTASAVVFNGNQTIDFDGNIFVSNLTSTLNSKVLANYVSNNSSVPYIWREEVGAGSFTFVNLPVLDQLSGEEQLNLLKDTWNVLSNGLPTPDSCQQIFSLPYDSDIMKYVLPSVLSLRFMNGFHQTLIFYNSPKIIGDISSISNNLFLYSNLLSVNTVKIQFANNSQIISNVSIYNLTVKGDVKINAVDSEATVEADGGGSVTTVDINSFEQCTITATDAQLSFDLFQNGETNTYAMQDVNITIVPSSAFSFMSEGLSIGINGSLMGNLQGAIYYGGNFYYTPNVDNRTLTGTFYLQFLYNSGIIYSKINKPSNLTISGCTVTP